MTNCDEIKVETLPRSWYGDLSETNVEKVAAMIRARLSGRYFSIASSSAVNRTDPRLELRTGCQFRAEWTDGVDEPVRVWGKEGERYLSFAAGGVVWMFFPWEKTPTRFSFDYDGFEVEFVAPCGDRHKHFFRAEPAERDCGKCEGWHDLSLPCEANA